MYLLTPYARYGSAPRGTTMDRGSLALSHMIMIAVAAWLALFQI
jgi:hypothetical protein